MFKNKALQVKMVDENLRAEPQSRRNEWTPELTNQFLSVLFTHVAVKILVVYSVKILVDSIAKAALHD
jgi:hypothetical protein